MILLADLCRFCVVGSTNFLLMVAQAPGDIHTVLYSFPPSLPASHPLIHTIWVEHPCILNGFSDIMEIRWKLKTCWYRQQHETFGKWKKYIYIFFFQRSCFPNFSVQYVTNRKHLNTSVVVLYSQFNSLWTRSQLCFPLQLFSLRIFSYPEEVYQANRFINNI